MAKYVIAVSKKTRDTLNELSKLSGLDVKFIVDEWGRELQKILDKRGSMQRISLMSICSKKHDNVITIVNPLILEVNRELVSLKMPLQTEVSGELGELKGEVEKNE